MRKLVYVMENGTIETSMNGAKAMDMPYTIAFESIHEEKPEMLPKQIANRKKVAQAQ